MTAKAVAADVERVVAYLNSDEGIKALRAYNAELDETYRKLRATRIISQELLHAPFTI